MEPWTFSGDGSKLYCPLYKTAFWDVQRDLALRPLTQPNSMPGRTHQVVFDYKGERVLFARNDRLTVWDLARNQVLKLLKVELGYGGVTATPSPDGRWLAAVVGSRDAPVVVWDLDVPDTAAPAHSLDAICNLDQSDCIRRLCRKISVAIDEARLRELVGDEGFDQLGSTIRTARCEG